MKACDYAAQADELEKSVGAADLINNDCVDLAVDATRTVLGGGCAVVYAAERDRLAREAEAAADGD